MTAKLFHITNINESTFSSFHGSTNKNRDNIINDLVCLVE